MRLRGILKNSLTLCFLPCNFCDNNPCQNQNNVYQVYKLNCLHKGFCLVLDMHAVHTCRCYFSIDGTITLLLFQYNYTPVHAFLFLISVLLLEIQLLEGVESGFHKPVNPRHMYMPVPS